MSKRRSENFTISEKLEIVLLHLEEGKSLSWLTRNQGISKDTLSNWVRSTKKLVLMARLERKAVPMEEV